MLKNITANATVSAKRGLVYLEISNQGVDGPSYCEYIK
jgi:hypothetical protein